MNSTQLEGPQFWFQQSTTITSTAVTEVVAAYANGNRRIALQSIVCASLYAAKLTFTDDGPTELLVLWPPVVWWAQFSPPIVAPSASAVSVTCPDASTNNPVTVTVTGVYLE